ncbi:MAG TPA: hypothetical protein VN810_05485 [Terriglobales bacterium]|nr:hypothetical protein [Terriglobales bacterium]
MKRMSIAALLVGVALLLPALALAQAMSSATSTATPPSRPFHDGPVWTLTFVHTKPGLGLKYMEYLATEWKKEQDAMKKAGFILDYKVIGAESHSPTDWDLMLMTEYKDLATLEANEDKMEAVAMQALDMNDQKMLQGYQERSSWREIIGDRLAREIILEPKSK